MKKFFNITYPEFLQSKFVLEQWKKHFCKNGFHLFDEVDSYKHHYLFCDACGLVVDIDDNRRTDEN